VGIAEHVGHQMTFKMLTDDTQKVISRSNICSALGSNAQNLCLDLIDREFLQKYVKFCDDSHTSNEN
jgi:hypothetical protein